MAFKHGKNTQVLLGAVDLSPYLNNTDFSADADTADTTVYSAGWKSSIVGTIGAKAEFAGFYDPAVTALTNIISSDPTGVLTYSPAGATAIGDRVRMMLVGETGYAESSPVGGAVGIKVSMLGSGVVGFGDMLHPLAEDTNTTTGAEKDDTAATSTGWTAHLHVTAVDAGSWVIKLQDAAVSNTYSDLTSGAFTAATTPTSQRLVGASGATLRRYVRYVATRTGGAGGDGITFTLAYSRN